MTWAPSQKFTKYELLRTEKFNGVLRPLPQHYALWIKFSENGCPSCFVCVPFLSHGEYWERTNEPGEEATTLLPNNVVGALTEIQ